MNKMKKRKGRPRTEAEPRSRLLSVPVTPSDYDRLKRLAKTRGCTLAEYIRLAIKAADGEEDDDDVNDMKDRDRDTYIMSTDGDSPKIPVQQKLKLGDVRAPRRTKRAAA